jgi:hypothetical protein
MPMVAREPGPHQSPVLRSGHEPTIGTSAPPADLLPPGGGPAAAPAPAPDRALALDALRLLRGLRDPRQRSVNWSDPAFAREVELVRCHLAPLTGRNGLKASFGREAFQTLGRANDVGDGPLGPVRAAYALRWLELGDRLAWPSWPSLLEGRRRA